MTMKVRALAISMLMTSAMWLTGCGHYVCTKGFGATTCGSGGDGGKSSGGGGNSSGSTYLFIADAGGIQGEVFDASAGTIKITPNFGDVSVSTAVPGAWMAVAQEQFLYSAYADIGQIYGWSIAQDGTLATLSGSPYPAPYLLGNSFNTFTSPSQAMITNPAGTLLFVVDQAGEQIDIYQIGSDGGLTAMTPVSLPSGFKPYNLATDGLGTYLYVSNVVGLATSEVAAFTIGSTGTLTAVSGSPFSLPLMQMQGESSDKYMIGTTGGFTGNPAVYVMSVNQSSGSLTAVPGSPFGTFDVPYTVAVQPNSGGTLIYAFDANTDAGVIEGFQIDLSSGNLGAIAGSPFTAAGVGGSFDQTGQYLFVVESSNNVASALDAFNVGASPTLSTPTASVGWAPGAWVASDVP